MSDAQWPDIDWPPRFDEWNKGSQHAFFMLSFQRHEIIRAIGDRAGITSIQARRHQMDPSTARLTKEELAELALFIGVYLDPYPDRRDR